MRIFVQSCKSRLFTALAAIIVCAGFASTVPAQAQNAARAMASDPNLSKWTQIVGMAGLMQGAATNEVTVFAITNEGFDKINGVWRNALSSPGSSGSPNFQRMQQLVRSQAIFGLYPMSTLTLKKTTLTSVAGTPITIDAMNPAHITVTMAHTTATISGNPIVTSQAVIYPVVVEQVNP